MGKILTGNGYKYLRESQQSEISGTSINIKLILCIEIDFTRILKYYPLLNTQI